MQGVPHCSPRGLSGAGGQPRGLPSASDGPEWTCRCHHDRTALGAGQLTPAGLRSPFCRRAVTPHSLPPGRRAEWQPHAGAGAHVTWVLAQDVQACFPPPLLASGLLEGKMLVSFPATRLCARHIAGAQLTARPQGP